MTKLYVRSINSTLGRNGDSVIWDDDLNDFLDNTKEYKEDNSVWHQFRYVLSDTDSGNGAQFRGTSPDNVYELVEVKFYGDDFMEIIDKENGNEGFVIHHEDGNIFSLSAIDFGEHIGRY